MYSFQSSEPCPGSAFQELEMSGQQGLHELVFSDKIHIKLNSHGAMTMTSCRVMDKATKGVSQCFFLRNKYFAALFT